MTSTAILAGRILDLDIADYATDMLPGCPGSTLRSGQGRLILDRSEFHAWWESPMNPEWEPDPPSDLMNRGEAAHRLLLEPEKRDKIFPIPYTDWRAARAREMRDDALADGLIPLLAKEATNVKLMADRARVTLLTSPDLDGLGETRNESTYWWRETRVNQAGLERDCLLRCRPDMVSADATIIVSYKTTSTNPHPDAYFKTLLNAGTDLQAAWEIAGVEAVEGTRVTNYVWLVQENEPPFACSLIGLSPQMRHYAMTRFDKAVSLWGDCLASQRFPAYPERIAYPEMPAWLMREIEGME